MEDYSTQTITLDKGHLLTDHPLAIAQTIIHEALHAYMNIHQLHCYNIGSSPLTQAQIDSLPQLTMDELLNEFSFNCTVIDVNDHRLMYNQMLTIMDQMLMEVLNDLVAPEDIGANFSINSNYSFNWNEAIHYLNLGGLQKAQEYIDDAIGNPQMNIPPNFPDLEFLKMYYDISVNCNNCNNSFNHNTCN